MSGSINGPMPPKLMEARLTVSKRRLLPKQAGGRQPRRADRPKWFGEETLDPAEAATHFAQVPANPIGLMCQSGNRGGFCLDFRFCGKDQSHAPRQNDLLFGESRFAAFSAGLEREPSGPGRDRRMTFR